jgi:hypothetical protein
LAYAREGDARPARAAPDVGNASGRIGTQAYVDLRDGAEPAGEQVVELRPVRGRDVVDGIGFIRLVRDAFAAAVRRDQRVQRP